MFVFIFLVVVGLLVGGQINRAIYRWAWNTRSISPWSQPPQGVSARTWFDCIPVVGWWGLRRESKIHGTLFWLRPMLIEACCGAGLAGLYYWEVTSPARPLPLAAFVGHAVLFGLMIVATFIDLDERTIPDFITVPGTLFALVLSASVPQSLLPVGPAASPISITTPYGWSPSLNGSVGLILGLVCWCGWCYALLPKTIFFRRGIGKGMLFLVASIQRHPLTKPIALMGGLGGILICVFWFFCNASASWQALLSSLVGLAFAGGLVWSIRIVAGYVLGVEAMGFGDVTLMAMIGAFLGWQAALIAFFLAPFTSILIATAQWLITGDRHIAFGPFLCAGTSIVLVGWDAVWNRWGPLFQLGVFIPLIIGVAIAAMGIMLGLLQLVKGILGMQHQS